jgi:alanine racemase
MCLLEMDGKTMAARLEDLPPVAMRLEQKSALNGCTMINDSYNSDFNSLSIALDVLNRQRQHRKKTLILSDILQSGQKQEELYGKIATLVNETGVSRIIGIGPAITRNSEQFSIPGAFYESTQAFLTHFNPKEFRDEAILIKGSRQFAFEQISSLLELKKHTTRIEINLDALVHNLNYFRSLLLPGTKTMVMVKALSYGSGRHEIASILEFQRIDYLGVAIADEGISLRQAGVTLPVMVMNPEPESFDAIIHYRLEPEIYSFRMLEMFHKATVRNQEIDYPVHLKLDTGMHRLGFLSAETDTLCRELKRFKNITVRSVFSHLAASDAVVHDAFTRSQIDLFRQMSDQIQASLGYKVIRHILNSAGIERFPEAQFDMVRLGIGLYGISCISGVKLKTVSTLKSTISQIKSVMPDETVGYGREGRPGHPARVAIVPIGYGDGLNRRLSNGKGRFLVDGKLVPIVGNICMDMTMIEVTDTRAMEGDEVVIFGDNPAVNDLSRDLDTIPYEVLTGISERVKRVYIHE